MMLLSLITALLTVITGPWELRNANRSDMPVVSTTVPSTVLSAYVDSGFYPDPRRGLAFYDIPDASDPGNPWLDPYVYSTDFSLPSRYKNEKYICLRLNGINYRADVTLNGEKIADRDTVVGMFRRFDFDVTSQIRRSGNNHLEITIYQVDHPGKCLPGTQSIVFGPKRGSARDIWRDETLKISGGWDCAPVVPDRNMGITLPVEISGHGILSLSDPSVTTEIAPDFSYAYVRVKVPVVNHDTKCQKADFMLGLSFPEGSARKPLKIQHRVMVQPGINEVELPVMKVDNPDLWWPVGYGEHPLHELQIDVKAAGRLSDSRNVSIGLREVRSEVIWNHGEPARIFYVNGRRIFCRGGWLQPDILLRNSEENFEAQAALLEQAGVNIAGSEDMPAPEDYFYSALDRHGILYWHVFHQCWRMYPGTASAHNPDDHNLAARHVEDEILRYRCHPCIAAWVGVNEVMVDEDLYIATKEAASRLDPSRPFIPTTSVDWDVDRLTPFLKDDLPIGTTDAGAPDYGWEYPEYFFQQVEKVKNQTFRNELGMPAMPVWSSLVRFIPTLDRPYDASDPIFPLDKYWAEHGAWDTNNFCYRGYDSALRTLYPDPRSARQYVRHGQLASYEGYRAMWEAAGSRMWDITTGVMLWKLNSCWPDVCWQIYDWYLAPNSAYFATKKVLERVHVQMNADDDSLCVVNTGDEIFRGEIRCEIYTPAMKLLHTGTHHVDVTSDAVTMAGRIPVPDIDGSYFVRLRLFDGEKIVSENLYWKYNGHRSYYGIVNMPTVTPDAKVSCRCEGGRWKMEIELANNTDRLSFFNHLELTCDGKVIHAVQWSDNFVSVFPGESISVTAECSVSESETEPVLIIENYER